MSLDGSVTGPGPSREATERSGPAIMGRRLFDIIDGPGGWDDEVGYGAGLAATPPAHVVYDIGR